MSNQTTNKELWSFLGEFVMDGERKRFKFNSPTYYQQMIQKAPLGKKIHVTFSTKVPTRSQQQLRYYWVVINLICEHTGYEPLELHDWIMREKFGTSEVTIRDKTHHVRRSIADVAKMKKYEAVELIEYTLQLAADLDVRLPTMAELGYIQN